MPPDRGLSRMGMFPLFHASRPMDFAFEHIDLAQVQFTTELLRTVPPSIARRHLALPVGLGAGSLILAVPDLSRSQTLDEIARTLGRDVEFRSADRELLLYLVNRFYDEKETL